MKQTIAAGLRFAGLMPLAERVRYYIQHMRMLRGNLQFQAENPGLVLPPAPLLYEISSSVDYRMHIRSGLKWAKRFWSHIEREKPTGELALYEWGCGVGRIIRHMQAMSPRITRAAGSDYDPRMIDWCARSLPGIEFFKNDLMPPTQIPDETFDAAFCYSVFTHLSEDGHIGWINELTRIVKPGGLVMFTTMGDVCRRNLLPSEQAIYDRGELVIRTDRREGSRLFAAYQSPAYVRSRMVNGHEIVAHEAAAPGPIAQDLWVVRRH